MRSFILISTKKVACDYVAKRSRRAASIAPGFIVALYHCHSLNFSKPPKYFILFILGNREQGTGNREQGTGNREQGTGNREQ